MPEYTSRLVKPDGTPYKITGPDGATPDQVDAEVRRQHPDAKASVRMGEVSPARGKLTKEEAMRQAPYIALSLAGGPIAGGLSKIAGPTMAKLGGAAIQAAGGAGIGALEAPEGKKGSGAIGGAVTQVAGDVLGRTAAAVAQRIGSRAFNRVSNHMADELMEGVKKIVPAWKTLPAGQGGVQRLVENEGLDLLRAQYAKDVQAAFAKAYPNLSSGDIRRITSSPELVNMYRDQLLAKTPALAYPIQDAQRIYAEGLNAVKALRKLNVLDLDTKRLNPEALVEGVSKSIGASPKTVWDTFLNKAPETKELIRRLVPSGMQAPELLPMPFLGAFGQHMRLGESLGRRVPLGTIRVPPTGAEDVGRRMTGAATGTALRELSDSPPTQ